MRSLVLLALCLAAVGCIGPTPDPATSPTAGDAPSSPSATTVCAVEAPGSTSQTSGVQVSNEPGAFSYSGSVAAANGKQSWKWQNPTALARASWQGSTATGSFTLTVTESCGAKVMHETFAPASQQATRTSEKGTPGAWLITIETSAFTGSVQLSVTSG